MTPLSGWENAILMVLNLIAELVEMSKIRFQNN